MPDYSKGKIYKLYNDDAPDQFYYGSTIQSLAKRLGGHKLDWIRKSSMTSKQLFNISDNVKIVLCEYFPCTDKFELLKRERYYIENNNCINKNIPGRSKKQYRIDNKDRIKEQHKQYNFDNKDRIKEQCRQYNFDNQDKQKEQHKQYYINNQNKIKETHNQYYQNNKDKIKQYDKYCKSDFGILCRNYF